jgi:hypothetical protein
MEKVEIRCRGATAKHIVPPRITLSAIRGRRGQARGGTGARIAGNKPFRRQILLIVARAP